MRLPLHSLISTPTVLASFHDSVTAGHPGIARILSSLTRADLWPSVQQEVIRFCRSCNLCQQTKISTQPQSRELIDLPIPARPWSFIGIDFITKLSVSCGYNSIFVITNHLTKGAHFIPCREAMDSQALAHLFFREFFCLHGFPDKIVSDIGPSFVLALGCLVLASPKISPAPSTAYHPKTC